MCSDIARCSASWPQVPAMPQQPDGRIVSRRPKAAKTRRTSRARRRAPWCAPCSGAAAGTRPRPPTAGSRSRCRASHSCDEQHGGRLARVQGAPILRAVGQRHRRIEADKRHAGRSQIPQHRRIRAQPVRSKAAEEPVHVQRLAVRAVRRQPGPEARAPGQDRRGRGGAASRSSW